MQKFLRLHSASVTQTAPDERLIVLAVGHNWMAYEEISFPEQTGLLRTGMSSLWCRSQVNDTETLGMRQHDSNGHLHSWSKLSKTAVGKIKSDIQFLVSCSTHMMSKAWH